MEENQLNMQVLI